MRETPRELARWLVASPLDASRSTGDRVGAMFAHTTAVDVLDRLAACTALFGARTSRTHADALGALDDLIERVQALHDEVMAALYRTLRPVERSYRLIQLFFENAEVRDTVERRPVDLYVLNGDTRAIWVDPQGGRPGPVTPASEAESSTIAAVDDFVQGRNDTFVFREYLSNLVIPGHVPDRVRWRLEDIAAHWGLLLVGDLRDEPSLRAVRDQFRADGGVYAHLQRPDVPLTAAVVVGGYAKLREGYDLETPDASAGATGEDADLYAPASLVFAGRASRTPTAPTGSPTAVTGWCSARFGASSTRAAPRGRRA